MRCHSVVGEVIHHPKLLIKEMPNIRIKPVYKGKPMIFPSIVLQEEKEIHKCTNQVKLLYDPLCSSTVFCCLLVTTLFTSKTLHFESFIPITHFIPPGFVAVSIISQHLTSSWASLAYRRRNPSLFLKCWGSSPVPVVPHWPVWFYVGWVSKFKMFFLLEALMLSSGQRWSIYFQSGWSADPVLEQDDKIQAALFLDKHLDCKDKSLPDLIRNGKPLQSRAWH